MQKKLILITGASSGIGKEIALLLSNHDADLILVGRNEKTLKELKHRILGSGTIDYYVTDLSDLEQVHHFLGLLKKECKEPDILIHSAGVFHSGKIGETSNDDLHISLTVNYLSPYIITRELLASLVRKRGAVLFINSTAAIFPKAHVSAYAASKSALKSFADVLYEEVSSKGVRVSSIYPGRVATPMQEAVCKKEGSEYDPGNFISPETIAQNVIQILNLPRNAEVKELIIRQPRKTQ